MALPNTALPVVRPARPLLRLALGAALVTGAWLPVVSAPAAAAPAHGSLAPAPAAATVEALTDRCGVRVTLAPGLGTRDVVVTVRTAAPTSPADAPVALDQDGRYAGDAGTARDLPFDLGDARAGDPQGQRVDVTVTVDGGAPETTGVWLPACVPSPSPSGSPTASPGASPTAFPSGTPTGSPSASPSGTPTATPSASPSGTPTVTPSATATATTTPALSPRPTAGTPAPAAPVTGGGGLSGTVALGGVPVAAPAPLTAPLAAVPGPAVAQLPALAAPQSGTAPVAAAPLPQVAADAQLFPAPPAAPETGVVLADPVAAPLTEEPGALADVLPAGSALALCVLALHGLVRRRRA